MAVWAVGRKQGLLESAPNDVRWWLGGTALKIRKGNIPLNSLWRCRGDGENLALVSVII